MSIKRGDIYYADLSPVVGSEQSGIRPILIIQNDIGNKFSPTIIGVPITSKAKINMPTHIAIQGNKYGLDKDYCILGIERSCYDPRRIRKGLQNN